jgi:hypothetical protein
MRLRCKELRRSVNVLLTFSHAQGALMNPRTHWLCLACLAALGIVGCEKQGPLEQAGEEVDEAIDTARNGRESTANKVDDAIDAARASADDATDELKKD